MAIFDEKDFGRRLKEARSHAGVTQTDAADAAGAKQSYISSIESGRIQPTPAKLSALLERYGASADFVFGQSEQWFRVRKDRPGEIASEVFELITKMSPAHREDLLGIARQFASTPIERGQLLSILGEIKSTGGEDALNSLLRFIGRFLPPDSNPGEKPDSPV